MKYYLDITLLPDTEISFGFLWEKVYQQVHIALAENKIAENKSAIAVSFPGYNDIVFPLGNKLRLFANTKEQLEKLNIIKWLNRLTDYTHCTSVKEIPNNISQYVCFKRKQFKSLEKKARRRVEHLNKPYSEVLEFLTKEEKELKCNLPFINMVSESTQKEIPQFRKHRFPLFIEQELVKSERSGDYNCYGLSSRDIGKIATVPWF